MFSVTQTAQDLETMLKEMVLKSGIFVPINKDSIRYKKYLIVKGNECWNVFHVDKRKKYIATTFLKVTSFAVCKLHEKHQEHKIDELLKSDKIFEKNYVDSLYYRNTFKKTKDLLTRDNALWRYEIAHDKAKQSKQLIDRIFYSSIA